MGLIGFSTIALGQSVTLSLGSGQGTLGGTVVLPITITSAGGAQATDIQWSLVYSPDITDVMVSLGNSGTIAQKSISCNGNLCVVTGLSGTIIPDGTLAIATFQIAANISAQTIPIQITGVFASTTKGTFIPAGGVSGVINVPPIPATVSVSPSASAGTTQIFSFVFSDSQSAANLSTFAILFAPSVAYPNSCLVVFDQNQGTVQLEWDNFTGADAKLVSSTLTVQNSQCMIGAATETTSSRSTTVTLAITFTGAFSGLKNIYMYGADGDGTINTGWLQMGTYTVTTMGAPVPTAVSVSPSGSGGAAQDFTFLFSDSQNGTNLSTAAMLFAPSLAFPNSCFVIYDRNEGTIQLEWDNVSGADKMPVGSSTSLQNSQCMIGATSVTTSALTTSIALAITFKGTFGGLKSIYMYGADGNGTINTGWVQRGAYTVNTVSAPVPSAVSASPNANSGTLQTFAFVFSDSQSATNLSTAALLFATSGAYPNSCFIIYDRNHGTIQLEWDNASGADEMPVGSSLTVQNSQCLVRASSVSTSSLSITITLTITFKDAFSGLKIIYMYGADGNGTINTGWVQMGTYAVTTVSAPVPSAVSVSPSGSGGAAQDFTFLFSDSQNAANLSAAAMLFAPTLAPANSCFVIYDRNEGTMQLEWDNVAGADLMPIGSSMTLQNSQCSISSSSVTTSGLSNIIKLHIVFKNAFSGLKNIYLYGADTDGTINTGWVPLGTWTPF